MSNNVNDITRGAVAVLIAQIQQKEEEGLTVPQAAQVLGVSVSQLNLMRKNNQDPQFYKEDGKILYSPSSIREFIQASTKKSKHAR
ncbi:helix-turn-helix domain-containing protein [Sulfurimonas sp.]|uniref:helix-turn-helix domain-containing protein n=1 Tax=Sulfurimonas sp. TaxID=2022749 RepID=UPI0025DB90D7|nr:helix-turn-helix domain-containing protein [Sulfurimonas sp.]MBW6488998.1 helix-turn-helix domain-containing protein [Sulfurimonas sp.]